MTRLYAYMTVAAIGMATDLGAQSRRERDRDDRYTARTDTTFAFGPRGSGEVSVPGGDIIIRAWNQSQVRVRAATERGSIRVESSSTFFSVGLSGSHSRGTDARFEITVPVGTRIKANTQTGDISITGTKGEIEAHTISGDMEIADGGDRVGVNLLSGDVTLRRITGDLRVNAVSGDVVVVDATGDVEVVTVSGDVELSGVTSRRVRAKTTSGDVSYEGSIEPAGRYEFGSHSGEVDVVVPQSVSAQVTVATFSGSIESDFPVTLPPGSYGFGSTNSKRFTFTIGKGEARIVAESFSGDVTIRQRGRNRDRSR